MSGTRTWEVYHTKLEYRKGNPEFIATIAIRDSQSVDSGSMDFVGLFEAATVEAAIGKARARWREINHSGDSTEMISIATCQPKGDA